MPDEHPNYSDAPIFVLTQIGNDARNAADVLQRARIRTQICSSIRDLCDRADYHTGALLISQEVMDGPGLACLLEFLKGQPPWSDIPMILLTPAGEITQRTYGILNFFGARANITLLEKPLRAITLASVSRAALRARRHQYEVRDLLEDYARAVENAQTATAKFRAIFDQSSVFAGIMTLDGVVIEANRLCLEACGYHAEDVLGRPFWECGWWSASKEVQEKIRACTPLCAAGTPYREILPYVWADGTEHMMEFGLYPIRDDAGRVIFLHPTGVDITERHNTQADAEFLAQLTQKLSSVSDPAEINRIAIREIGEFLAADHCFFLQPAPEANQIRVLPDWPRDDLTSLEGDYPISQFGRKEWWRAVQLGPVAIDDVRTHPWTKNSQTLYQSMKVRAYTLAPFIQEDKWVACIGVNSGRPRVWTERETRLLENAVARVWPLIERARSESALRQANVLLAHKATHLESLVQERTAKLRETIGELEAFSYSIAHDMRAPLRSLEGFSSLLLTDHSAGLDEEARHLLTRIAHSAERMDKLIRDVLNYSRVVRSDFPLEKVAVEPLLRGILDSYPMLAPDKVDVSIRGPFPLVIGNEAMLTQIFSNLMGNAVKFVPPGRRPRLEVWAETRDNFVRLSVRDNGIGIAPDQHEKIFGIFQRVNKEFEGTGIGLAIVQKTVERMGGKLGLQSELGQGSTFWFEVPLAEPALP